MRRVVLVDDHALFRAGVRSELEGRVEVVGEAGTVEEAVALIESAKPDVVLLDVHMPDGGGVAVATRCSGRDDERLADAIERVAEGDAVFSPRLAGFVLDAFRGDPTPSDSELDQLTPRELEVLRLIARGYLYKEVAHQLGISAKTVEAHVTAVLRKLQLSNRHALSRWAMEQGLD